MMQKLNEKSNANTLEQKFNDICININKILSIYSKISLKINQFCSQMLKQFSGFKINLNLINNEIFHLKEDKSNARFINSNENNKFNKKSSIIRELKRRYFCYKSLNSSRTCWKCKKNLNFDEICERNINVDKKKLSILWDHPNIQFYCCSCYDRLNQEEIYKERVKKSEKIRFNLDLKEREALTYIERTIGRVVVATDDFTFQSVQYWSKIPEFIVKKKHLIALKLTYCALHYIPPELQIFNSLQYLDLSYNSIKTLPEWIKSMPSLRTIILLGNQSINIHDSFFQIKNLEILPETIRINQLENSMRYSMRMINNEVKQKIRNEILNK